MDNQEYIEQLIRERDDYKKRLGKVLLIMYFVLLMQLITLICMVLTN